MIFSYFGECEGHDGQILSKVAGFGARDGDEVAMNKCLTDNPLSF